MRKNNKIVSPVKKNILIWIMIFSFAGSLNAQTKETKVKTTEEKPLVLKLSSPKKKFCLQDGGVELTLELINAGNKPLTIDRKFLWIHYYVSHYKNGIGGGYLWHGDGDFNQPYGDYVLLEPKQSYKETRKFLFIREDKTKEDFFDREGRYDIEFSYQIEGFDKTSPEIAETIYSEKITSNETSFYLKKCRPK